MKYFFRILSGVFIFIAVTACSNSDNEKVKIVEHNFSKSYCSNDSDLCAKLTINLQTISNSKNEGLQIFINSRIKNAVFSRVKDYNPNTVQESIEDTVAANFFGEYKSFLKDFPDYQIGWEISVYDSIIFLNKSFVTVKVSGLFFTGGAHPNSFTNFKTYNFTTVSQPTLKNLFKPGFEKKLLKIAEAEFRKQKRLTISAGLNKSGYWFKDNKFTLNDNWGIVKTGILFFYDDYEIAPHSMGTTQLLIPFSKIKDLIENKILLQKNIR